MKKIRVALNPLSALVLGLSFLFTLGWAAAGPDPQAQFEAWKQQRDTRLRNPAGWLAVVGLDWLSPGENLIGSSPKAQVRLSSPGIPAEVASLVLAKDQVTLHPRPGVPVKVNGQLVSAPRRLQSDAAGAPDLVSVGILTFHVIQRGERIGVRTKDPKSRALAEFRGVTTFPFAPAFRVEARFERFETPIEVAVPTAIGTIDHEQAFGKLVFTVGGQECALVPFGKPGEELFVVFSDATSGETTYGGGRFLNVAAPVGGRTVIDFNQAENPPCAFTPHATCPRPPKENRLKVAVTAGEKTYGEH